MYHGDLTVDKHKKNIKFFRIIYLTKITTIDKIYLIKINLINKIVKKKYHLLMEVNLFCIKT